MHDQKNIKKWIIKCSKISGLKSSQSLDGWCPVHPNGREDPVMYSRMSREPIC